MDKNIENTNITSEMRDCYIDYAMSVIIGRALPDVRDGMKPVHRRILYAMYELGLTPDRQFRKCVRIVGDVLGKFHPHGDTAVYEALTRMAQDFSTRYPTVMGHGNFGSIDGDSPAAMRYTEAKMDHITSEMLRDINKDTVDFVDNFDGSEMEPEVLTSRFPHILVNGSSGIAVGMATNMPPHNLGEVIDATIEYINDPNISVKKLMKKLPGPDFPTGAIIHGVKGIRESYQTGTGRINMRGKAQIHPISRGRNEIVITELPYQVNKAKLIQKIASLQNEKRIHGITEIRDESDLKQGVKIVIDVKKGVNPKNLLKELYKLTELEKPFNVINLALVPDDNHNLHPRILPLTGILDEYVKHQRSVIIRRTEFDLKRAKNRAHIVEGLLIALDNIDEIINIIRHSQNTKTAGSKLQKRFKLTEIQAQAILDMRLQRLVGLERKKLKDEYKELLRQIKEFEKILASQKEVDNVIIKELKEIKKNYGDKRRTRIITNEITEEPGQKAVVKKENIKVWVTEKGYINGRGIKDVLPKTADDDPNRYIIEMTTFDSLVVITSLGRAYTLRGSEIPRIKGRGKRLKGLFKMSHNESVINIIPTKDFETENNLYMLTKAGNIKCLKFSDLKSQVKNGINIIKLKDNDELISCFKSDADSNVIIATKDGYGIRFKLDSVKSQGRAAGGVKGINLSSGDCCIGMIKDIGEVVTVSEKGFVKKFESSELTLQGRAGKGLKIAADKQNLVSILPTDQSIQEVYLVTSNKIIKTIVSTQSSRTSPGKDITEDKVTASFIPENLRLT